MIISISQTPEHQSIVSRAWVILNELEMTVGSICNKDYISLGEEGSLIKIEALLDAQRDRLGEARGRMEDPQVRQALQHQIESVTQVMDKMSELLTKVDRVRAVLKNLSENWVL